MATRAARMLQYCVFEGSLSMSEMDKQCRPYHKNCSCALHRPKDTFNIPLMLVGKMKYEKDEMWKGN
ncbi:hypothetical protein L1987_77820 [Smallanthus sonchifolius]|uniref:Uncharacterized protein n=1 Tax=Smallanthus sonchifolius TaxID=185202 RepID=A0ACB8ZC10_9ASTR|nr:hypothetical protein L1987_77820 [Smallanthus sonchifolius]